MRLGTNRTLSRCHPEGIHEDARRTSTSAQSTNLKGGYGESFATGGVLAEVFESGFVKGFATVRYLRIFSSRFGPMPLIARKSSTLLNAPYDLRI
ncbi:MAG TPA: hypothetical protein VN454_06355, partial [Candidatus Angelobacter sp.]|nr:hypothetical protein [Candidatus Angelobacter sp.]